MRHYWKEIGQASAIVACCWLVSLGDQATAVEESSVLVEDVPPPVPQPPGGPRLLKADDVNYQDDAEVLSDSATPEPIGPGMSEDCCPSVPIDYDYKHRARRWYGSEPPIEMIMMVDDPADGLDCLFEVPLCLPACCTGDPQMRCWTGIFGRGFVEYRWPCGFQVEVEFKHRKGEIEVDYEG